jgi:hypothetical protein
VNAATAEGLNFFEVGFISFFFLSLQVPAKDVLSARSRWVSRRDVSAEPGAAMQPMRIAAMP